MVSRPKGAEAADYPDSRKLQMKTIKALVFLFLAAGIGFAASWDRLTLATSLELVDIEPVVRDLAVLQPWNSTKPLPGDFSQAGLKSPVALVACGVYFDGGSRYYLFEGANKKFLLLCTDPGSYYNPDKKMSEAVKTPRLYLGVAHFSDAKGNVPVPIGSATEHFLLAAIVEGVKQANRH
jgi:hypothetical protein